MTKNTLFRFFPVITLVMLASVAFSTDVAAAKIINTFYPKVQIHGDNDAHHLILRSGNKKSRTVTYRHRTKVAFIFTAECGVDGPLESRLDITIFVDGLPVKQTNEVQALCSGNAAGGVTLGRISGAISGMKVLNPGPHNITIVATPSDDVNGFLIDDLNLLMISEKS